MPSLAGETSVSPRSSSLTPYSTASQYTVRSRIVLGQGRRKELELRRHRGPHLRTRTISEDGVGRMGRPKAAKWDVAAVRDAQGCSRYGSREKLVASNSTVRTAGTFERRE